MPRLIDADALGDEFDQQMYYLRWEVDTEDNPNRLPHADAINWCRNTLNDAPIIDAVPVVHGHWLNTDEDDEYYEELARCSECGEYYTCECDIELFEQFYHYCSNCGAKMDKEDKE